MKRQPIPQSDLPLDLRDYEISAENNEKIPAQLLAVPEFIDLWEEWILFRAKVLRNPVTVRAARNQLKSLLEHISHANPVKVIELSIDRRYTGLFPQNINEEQEQKSGLVL